MPIPNKDVAEYVNRREVFVNNNDTLFAVISNDTYTVCSYDHSWPIYMYDYIARIWFVNSDKPYSPTTARHMSVARPEGYCHPVSRHYINSMAVAGSYANQCAARMTTNLEVST
jgi:hypothetical protein